VTDGRRTSLGRQVLGLAICYAVALQALFAAFGSALGVGQVNSETGFAICHPANGSMPPTGDAGHKMPCVLCALAAASGGLLRDAITTAALPLSLAHQVALVVAIATPASVPARAGLTRAPPSFA
jgi:hypothetical protein